MTNLRLIKEVTTENQETALAEVFELEMEKGDVVLVHMQDKQKDKLFICCPGCGSSSFTGNHKIVNNLGVFSATPSLVFRCCGWHGHLKNNEFTK